MSSVAGTKAEDLVEDEYGLYRHHVLVVSAKERYGFFEFTVLHLLKDRGIVEDTRRYYPGKFRKHNYEVKFRGYEAVKEGRRIMKLTGGRDVYNLLTFNCEHFVRMARTEETKSRQVRRLIASSAGMAVGATGAGMAGVFIGATIGSIIPVAGTIIGGFVGGLVGAVSGAVVGGVIPFAVDYADERFNEN